MKKGSLVFAIILLLFSIVLLLATMTYPLRSRLFPLIAISIVLILLIIQIIREVSALKGKKFSAQAAPETLNPTCLITCAWLGGTLIILWILGFMATVVLLPFLYIRSHREGWLISITLSLGCGIFFYALFGLALKMRLYPGLLFLKIFG